MSSDIRFRVPDWTSWEDVVIDVSRKDDSFLSEYPVFRADIQHIRETDGSPFIGASICLGTYYNLKYQLGSIMVIEHILKTVIFPLIESSKYFKLMETVEMLSHRIRSRYPAMIPEPFTVYPEVPRLAAISCRITAEHMKMAFEKYNKIKPQVSSIFFYKTFSNICEQMDVLFENMKELEL